MVVGEFEQGSSSHKIGNKRLFIIEKLINMVNEHQVLKGSEREV